MNIHRSAEEVHREAKRHTRKQEDALYRMKREAAIARLDCFRTEQANIRGMSR